MNLLQLKSVIANLVLLPAFLLFAPLLTTAQETTAEATTTEPLATAVETTDPVALGYTVERFPGSDEVFGDFVVGPGKVEVILNPGETKYVELTATNRTGIDRIFRFTAEDTVGNRDGGGAIVLLGQDRGPYSLKDYLDIPDGGVMIKHGQKVRIPIAVSIPPDAEPGGLYGSVIVETVTVPREDGPGDNVGARSPIVSRIGSLFFVTVDGDIERDGSFLSFTTVPDKKYFSAGPINFSLVYENRGSIHTTPYGQIEIFNYADESVGFLELEPWFVMPESLRVRDISWNRELLVGKYTAVAKVNRGYDDIVDEFTLEFWVIPWKLVAGVFGAVFLLVFIIRFLFTRLEIKRKT